MTMPERNGEAVRKMFANPEHVAMIVAVLQALPDSLPSAAHALIVLEDAYMACLLAVSLKLSVADMKHNVQQDAYMARLLAVSLKLSVADMKHNVQQVFDLVAASAKDRQPPKH